MSPKGGDLMADGFSDPEDESQYSAHDIVSLGFKKSATHAAMLEGTKSIADVSIDDYDAVFVAGGQSPMVTMVDDADLHGFIAKAYEAGKVVGIVCHGTSILLKTRLSNGNLLVKGKTWTGFADAEEKFADAFVGQKIQPFWIEEEARKLDDTNFVVQSMFKPFAVRDENLITGQQQFSGACGRRIGGRDVGPLGRGVGPLGQDKRASGLVPEALECNHSTSVAWYARISAALERTKPEPSPARSGLRGTTVAPTPCRAPCAQCGSTRAPGATPQ